MISYDICLCLTSLSMTISRSIHVAANGIISFFFYGWVMFDCIYVPHLLYMMFILNVYIHPWSPPKLQILYFQLPIKYLHWNVPQASITWLFQNWTHCILLLQICLQLFISWLTVRPSIPSFNHKFQCLLWFFSFPYLPHLIDLTLENSQVIKLSFLIALPLP